MQHIHAGLPYGPACNQKCVHAAQDQRRMLLAPGRRCALREPWPARQAQLSLILVRSQRLPLMAGPSGLSQGPCWDKRPRGTWCKGCVEGAEEATQTEGMK